MREMKESGVAWIGKIPTSWELKTIKQLKVERNEKNRNLEVNTILSLSAKDGITLYNSENHSGNKPRETVIDLKSKGKDLLDGAEYLAKLDRSLLNENRCPRCGCDLVKKTGKHGPFLGCSNYPYCNFTANIDAKTGEIVIKDKWR